MSALKEEETGSHRVKPIDVQVGARVRGRRILLGMSQENLGELLGLTFQQVQKYEKGTNRIGAGRLHELSRVLGVRVGYFFDEETTPAGVLDGVEANGAEMRADSDVADLLNSREGLQLNKAFVLITNVKVRRAIVDLVRSLVKGEGTS